MTQPNAGPTAGAPEPTSGPPEPSSVPQIPATGEPSATDRDAEIASLKSEAAKWRKALREKEQENESLKLAGASEAEKAVAAAKAEGAKEYEQRWRRSVLDNAALTVLAERGVTATEPALRSLDLTDVEIDADGKVDRTYIGAKVDELIAKYPMFAPRGSGAPMPTLTGDSQKRVGSPDQIARKGSLTEAEAEAMLRYGLRPG